MTDTMQAAVLYGKEDVRLEQVPIPTPGPGEVLIKIQSALTCGTDLKVFRSGSHAKMIEPPALFGHEFAGVIASVGPGVSDWKPGMRVVAANSAPCRNCFYCKKDQPNLCEDLLFANGAYAEFMKLPKRIVEENLLEIPGTLPFPAAALTEPLACVVHGIHVAQPGRGETVALLGAGPIGLMFAQLLINAGTRIILLGKGKPRLEQARALGLQTVLDLAELSDPVEAIRQKTDAGRGADLVIEAVGRPKAWEQALAISRPGGRVLLFGGCPAGTKVELDTEALHYGERSLLCAFHHTPEAIREALQLIAQGTLCAQHFISKEAPLSELPELLRRMLTEQQLLKMAILPEGS